MAKALRGERLARLALPDPLPVLEAKIASYEAFDRAYPGYGGFLPWYEVKDAGARPLGDWTDRVPVLDNGQLAWSLYLAADALERAGRGRLARRYRAYFEKLARNSVPLFFDPKQRKIRGEARMLKGNKVPPERNAYASHGYFMEDAYEGLLAAHFMDLFGTWPSEEDREVFWKRPLRKTVSWRRHGATITVEEAWVGSSHEQWGFLILPYRDDPRCDALFLAFQRARVLDASARGWPGLRASTHRPPEPGRAPEYVSMLGIDGIGREASLPDPIFAPYAAFPLALADRTLFAEWLKRMLAAPGMRGPLGIGESFDLSGRWTPLATWDGKALPLAAAMGGAVAEIRELLKRDGLYERFRSRVRADYDRIVPPVSVTPSASRGSSGRSPPAPGRARP